MDKTLSKDQVHQISIYGINESFTITGYTLKDSSSNSFFLTRQSTIIIKTEETHIATNTLSANVPNIKSKHTDFLLEIIRASFEGKSIVGHTKGILITGASGIGKSILIKQVQTLIQYPFLFVTGHELISKYMGDAEQKIAEIFNCAKEAAPAIIVFDDIHVYANVFYEIKIE